MCVSGLFLAAFAAGRVGLRTALPRKGATIQHTLYEAICLRSLHQEIDLFDRKLAHMALHEEFSSDADRKAASSKMEKKRETLAIKAREMAKAGVEFKDSELPRSFRKGESPAPAAAVEEEPAEAVEEEATAVPETDSDPSGSDPLHGSGHESPFAGTSLDGQRMLLEFKRKKSRKETLAAAGAKLDSAAEA